MPGAMVDQVRRFNRVVTERVGALNDRFLGLARPLGEARLLWEVGTDGCDVRLLRSRMGLDSGYVSRLLRSLEAAGLVEVTSTSAVEHQFICGCPRITWTYRGTGEFEQGMAAPRPVVAAGAEQLTRIEPPS